MRVALAVSLLGFSPLSFAQDAEAPSLEIYSGTAKGNARLVGLAGSFVSIADATGAQLVTPVAFTQRKDANKDSYTHLGLGLGLQSVPTLRALTPWSDELNDIDPTLSMSVGLNFKLGPHGMGTHLLAEGYRLPIDVSGRPEEMNLQVFVIGPGYAHAFWGGELILGVRTNITITTINIVESSFIERTRLLTSTGFHISLGALWAPSKLPFRLGMTFSPPATNANTRSDTAFGPLPISGVHLPLELRLGASVKLFGNPYNRRATYGLGDRTKLLGAPADRPKERYLLLTTEFGLTGGAKHAVSAFQLLTGRFDDTHIRPTFVGRFAAEVEVQPRVLRLRAGIYNEPGRYADTPSRMHGTAGVDIRLVRFPTRKSALMAFGFNADFAKEYRSFSIWMGTW